jgi:hypothetical protein
MNSELFLITNVTLEGTIVGRPLPVVAQVPNQHVEPCSFEQLGEHVSFMFDHIKKQFRNYNFESLILDVDYANVNTPDATHGFKVGFDKEGEVWVC